MEQAPFTNVQLNQFQALLVARVAELEHVLRSRDLIRVERSADQVDEVQQASERALAISNLDRETQQLRQARSALRRIQQGSFGVCEQCGENIHFKRLRALPWSAFCIECQDEWDRNRQKLSSGGLDESEFIQENEAA
jgi:DnaK suppressor protein